MTSRHVRVTPAVVVFVRIFEFPLTLRNRPPFPFLGFAQNECFFPTRINNVVLVMTAVIVDDSTTIPFVPSFKFDVTPLGSSGRSTPKRGLTRPKPRNILQKKDTHTRKRFE